jgi:hypothetical protein
MHDLRDCLLALITISGAGAAAALAAGSSLPYGEGGYVPNFVKIVRQYNMSGDEFRIEGVCKSACTMFLGIRDVCVERDARLMFHAGHDIAENRTGPDTRASRAALYRYNANLRRYLLEGHYMDTEAYHTLTGSDLIDRFGYRECPPKQ